MAADEKPQGFWASIPGILTALAAVMTAGAGLVIALKPSATSTTSPDKVAVLVADPPKKPAVVPAPAATASNGNGNGSDSDSDSASILSVTPQPGQRLVIGQETEFTVRVRYSLRTTPSAVMAVYVAEFPEDAKGCSGPMLQTDGGMMAPVLAADREQERVFHVKWRRGSGQPLKRDLNPAARGFAALGINFWSSNDGQSRTLLHGFGVSPGACYPFGPAA